MNFPLDRSSAHRIFSEYGKVLGIACIPSRKNAIYVVSYLHFKMAAISIFLPHLCAVHGAQRSSWCHGQPPWKSCFKVQQTYDCGTQQRKSFARKCVAMLLLTYCAFVLFIYFIYCCCCLFCSCSPPRSNRS